MILLLYRCCLPDSQLTGLSFLAYLNELILQSVDREETGRVIEPRNNSMRKPTLANIYLHEVLDVWFEREVKPVMKGEAFLIRDADDLIAGFRLESDARWVMAVIPKRLGKYGLAHHPEKTRLVDFRRPKESDDSDDKGPRSFDLLGFTFYWAKSLKGNWVVKQKTSKVRLRQALLRIKEWCKANRHRPIGEQQQALAQKLKGHYGYYGRKLGGDCQVRI